MADPRDNITELVGAKYVARRQMRRQGKIFSPQSLLESVQWILQKKESNHNTNSKKPIPKTKPSAEFQMSLSRIFSDTSIFGAQC